MQEAWKRLGGRKMIKVRKNEERGNVNFGWLDSRYTFSFGNYYDPEYMGFSKLRVINEDWIKGGGGFGSHPHRDMEIITYMIDGELKHQDSMGNASVIRKNEIQKMTAGKGVVHSEFNNSETEQVHLLQIWIMPDEMGLEPSYEQHFIDKEVINGNLKLIASGRAKSEDSIVKIKQNVDLYLGLLKENVEVNHTVSKDRNIWIQVIKGSLHILEKELSEGDGAAINNVNEINIKADEASEFLLFDMN